MTKQDSFVSTVPFSGFYESIHSGEVDHTLERILTDRDSGSEPAPDFIQNAAFMAIDYSAVYRRYARAYVDSFAEWLGLDGKFESMDSPREYNFTTDRVYITLTRADVARLWRGVSRADMTKAAKARFTSYDGFISGYSSDWRTWGRLSDWDHNQLGTLLGAYAVIENGGDWDQWAEHGLVEDLNCNGDIDNWLFEEATKDLARAVNAWDYLQDRAKRAIKTCAEYLESRRDFRRAQMLPFEGTPLGQFAQG